MSAKTFPAVLAMMRVYMAGRKPTAKGAAIIYAVAIGNYQSMEGRWSELHDCMRVGLGWPNATGIGSLPWIRALDRIKKAGWDLHKATCEELQLDPTYAGAAPP